MRFELQEKCNLFADNRDKVAREFVWEPDNMYYIPALYYSMENKLVNIDAMKECQKLLVREEGVFSNFRLHLVTTIISRMALSDNPEMFLANARSTYAELLSHRFTGSEHLALAAMQFCSIPNKTLRNRRLTRMRTLYKRCDKLHPFLTNHEDVVLLAQLSASKRNLNPLLEDIEECLRLLRPVFPGHPDAMQSVAFVLSLSEKPSYDKCAAFIQLYRELEVLGMNYDKNHELAVLAAVSLLNADPVALAIDISDAEEFLHKRRGFGDLSGTGESCRVMYAALLTAESYYDSSLADTTKAELNEIMMAIASEIALLAAIAATAAACATT